MLTAEACWYLICSLSYHLLLKQFRNLSTTSLSSSIKIGFSTGIPYSRTRKVTKLIGFNIQKSQFFISVCYHCNTNLFRRQGQMAVQRDSLLTAWSVCLVEHCYSRMGLELYRQFLAVELRIDCIRECHI